MKLLIVYLYIVFYYYFEEIKIHLLDITFQLSVIEKLNFLTIYILFNGNMVFLNLYNIGILLVVYYY